MHTDSIIDICSQRELRSRLRSLALDVRELTTKSLSPNKAQIRPIRENTGAYCRP